MFCKGLNTCRFPECMYYEKIISSYTWKQFFSSNLALDWYCFYWITLDFLDSVLRYEWFCPEEEVFGGLTDVLWHPRDECLFHRPETWKFLPQPPHYQGFSPSLLLAEPQLLSSNHFYLVMWLAYYFSCLLPCL